MVEDFSKKRCKPCEGGVAPVLEAQAKDYLKLLKGWQLASEAKSIAKDYLMKDFMSAILFMNRIADVAETEDHHPDFHLTGYRKLRIELSTHAIGGLSENDFILASKIDLLPKALKQ